MPGQAAVWCEVTARPFLETLLVLAFLAGVLLTAGTYAENQSMVGMGAFFLMMFLGVAIAGALQLRRAMKKQKRYERSIKGFSWRG